MSHPRSTGCLSDFLVGPRNWTSLYLFSIWPKLSFFESVNDMAELRKPPITRLRRAAERVQQAEIERNRLIRGLRAERVTLKDLSEAASLSIGSVHRLTRPLRVVSLGYEGRDLEAFLDVLVEHDVDDLIDVRENAISRKRGFSKSALAEGCRQRGVAYRHERTLGNPRSNRDGYRTGDPESRVAYRSHLDQGGQEALERASLLLTNRTVGLMCFEADPHQCHRTMVVDALRAADPLVEVFEV